jgi:poly-gamma-glutamate synthesis protein (capsule biosynthesis protein)
MLGRLVNEDIPRVPPVSIWGTTGETLHKADAVIANLECAITTRIQRWSKTPKTFHFRADPIAVDVLKAGNIRCVSLANNHTLDYREEGLLDTLDHLDSAGIAHAGAGRNLEEAMRPAIVETDGLKVAVISLTDNEPAFAATARGPGTFYWPIRSLPTKLGPVATSARQARRAGAQLVVLATHWGPNMVTSPCDEFCLFGHKAIEQGVDVVYGHSAHVFHGVERYRNGLVLYDTGDFVDDYMVDPDLRNDWSFIFLVEVEHGGSVTRLRMLPVRLNRGRVDLATGGEADAIAARMESLCAAFGTLASQTPDGLEVALQPAADQEEKAVE